MRGRCLHTAAALTLVAVLAVVACSSNRAVATGAASPGEPAADCAHAVESVPGQKVTKEVPHSTESIQDIREREGKEPRAPRNDVAIPSHRILLGDNTVAPTPPSGAPAGIDKPGEPIPGGTGGY
jgi:hypothetical protein